MKNVIVALRLFSLSALLCGLSACASMETAQQKNLLTSAGFEKKTPTDAEQRAAYDGLPSLKLERGVFKGRVTYAYKIPGEGVVYIGGEPEYQKYLSIQKHQADAAQFAVQLTQNQAMHLGRFCAH